MKRRLVATATVALIATPEAQVLAQGVASMAAEHAT